jgi:hypothetical protein
MALGLFVFFPSLFLSGVALPVEAMPPAIARRLERLLPRLEPPGAMALAAVMFSFAATRLFRWQ